MQKGKTTTSPENSAQILFDKAKRNEETAYPEPEEVNVSEYIGLSFSTIKKLYPNLKVEKIEEKTDIILAAVPEFSEEYDPELCEEMNKLFTIDHNAERKQKDMIYCGGGIITFEFHYEICITAHYFQ